ncbi:MAG: polysaccharide export protein [Acidobacteriales bacterium]|nr:polysaccharide export protein [Terriglobales bacterium]
MKCLGILAGITLGALLPSTCMGQFVKGGEVLRVPGSPTNYRGYGESSQKSFNVFLRIPKISPDYQLGPGDVLRVEIVGQTGLSETLQTVTISNTGQISMPLLGPVQAADLTASQLEERIAAGLKKREFLQDPEVLVYITDYLAKPIYIVGEVDNPGEYVMSQQLTLMEAILMAGGLDFTADRYGYLHRKVSVDAPAWKPERVIEDPAAARPGRQVIRVDLEPLKTGGVLKPDILLKKGDVFTVPRRQPRLFYVIGDVRAPGAYDIPPPAERSILVSQAIAQAGGPAPTAKLAKGILVHSDDMGGRVERKIDFTAIMKGKEQDFRVNPNDVIFIPGSVTKTLQQGLLGAIPSAAQTSATTSIQNIGRR